MSAFYVALIVSWQANWLRAQIRSDHQISSLHDVQRFRVGQGAGEHHTSTRSHADALHHSMLRGAHLLCSDDLMDVRQ